MGKGASGGQDRRDGREKGGAGRGGAHRSDQTEPDSDPFKRRSVPGSNPDRGMDQPVRKDGGDLRRHRVDRVRKVRPNEDFKMPVAAAPVISAFADRLALGASAGEADRDAHAGG